MIKIQLEITNDFNKEPNLLTYGAQDMSMNLETPRDEIILMFLKLLNCAGYLTKNIEDQLELE